MSLKKEAKLMQNNTMMMQMMMMQSLSLGGHFVADRMC